MSETPAPDQKDPQLFTNWFQTTKEKLERLRKEHEDEAIRKTLASQTRIDELGDIAMRGQRASNFLASDFWTKDAEPFLRQEGTLQPWNPTTDSAWTFPRLILHFVLGSGRVRVLERFLTTLHRWIEDGKEADRKLKAEAEKRGRLVRKA